MALVVRTRRRQSGSSKAKKARSSLEVLRQLPDRLGVERFPASSEPHDLFDGSSGWRPRRSVVGRAWLLRSVPSPRRPSRMFAHLVRPAALNRDPGVDRLQSRRQAAAAVDRHLLHALSGQAPAVRVVEEPFPRPPGSPSSPTGSRSPPASVRQNPQANQDRRDLRPRSRPRAAPTPSNCNTRIPFVTGR